MMNPMTMMISGIIQMETCSDDIEPNDIEDEARDHILTLQCPTGGRDNILRFEKSVVGKITNADQRNGMTKPVDGGGDVCVQVQVDDTILDEEGGDVNEVADGDSAVHDQIPVDE